jgi:hypothetical protein
MLVVSAACGGDSPAAPSPTPAPPPSLSGVAIEGPPLRDLNFLGDTAQLRALATLSDGSRSDVTADVAWTVSNSAVLSVTPRGLVTALGYGASGVTGRYRERSAEVGVSVLSRLDADFRLTGVVRDASTRGPVAGARVWRGGADPGTFTDADGAFTHGGVIGPRTLFVSKLGYAFSLVDLPGRDTPTQVEVNLIPDVAPFIERSVVGTFDGRDPVTGLDLATHRIVTRAGGLFDAEVVRSGCGPGAVLSFEARSGGTRFPTTDMPSGCFGRLRFIAPADEIVVTVRGWSVPSYQLTYREPR